MKIKQWLLFFLTLSLLMVLAGSVQAIEPFRFNEYVVDQAGVLSATEQNQLAQQLKQYNNDTTNQVVVVTIKSLEGKTETQFAEELFKLNKPGQKGKNNGLILLVAIDEHKIRIETGYGLEEAVPDGKAGVIIREQIAPYFKNGDYYNGITAGVNAIIQAITPGYQLSNQPAPLPKKSDNDWGMAFIFAIVIAIFVLTTNKGNTQRRCRRGYSEPWYWGGGYGGGFGGSDSNSSSGDTGFSGGGGDFGGGGASGGW